MFPGRFNLNRAAFNHKLTPVTELVQFSSICWVSFPDFFLRRIILLMSGQSKPFMLPLISHFFNSDGSRLICFVETPERSPNKLVVFRNDWTSVWTVILG